MILATCFDLEKNKVILHKLAKRAFRASSTQRLIGTTARWIENLKGPLDPSLKGDAAAESRFREWLKALKSPRVLELGTRRTGTGIPTARQGWASPDATYICSDFMEGLDVDVVADAEKLSYTFGVESIDAVIACSVFEHIRRPWLAAVEIGKVLKPGGKVFVQTHFGFPIHAYPYDYWRFTRQALETLFGQDNGFKNVQSYYAFPCSILSPEATGNIYHPAFLNTYIVAEKA